NSFRGAGPGTRRGARAAWRSRLGPPGPVPKSAVEGWGLPGAVPSSPGGGSRLRELRGLASQLGAVSPGTPPVDKTDLKLQELLWPYLLSAGIKGVPPLNLYIRS
ncbi:hypothetical protein LEMLEM_LOCUS5300, partial [Lemmus lemmus]